jgi:hypothetical protein
MSNFEYRESQEGYEVECASCGCDVPLDKFERGRPRKEEYICEICAKSYVGNATEYPDQYENVVLFQALAQVGNLILDKLTDRKQNITRTVAVDNGAIAAPH